MDVEVVRDKWKHYLYTCETYGTPEQRSPEYEVTWDLLRKGGLADNDLIVDVGCGDQGLDMFLRSRRFRGQYLGIDGSIQGIDLNYWDPPHQAEWYVCLEVLEHLRSPEWLTRKMLRYATKGVVVSTPNADVQDVVSLDPTHVRPIHTSEIEEWGLDLSTISLNPGRPAGDTIFGWRYK